MAKLGADFIKVMGSGGGTPGTKVWLPSFSREEIAAVTEEAHRLDRKISVHCLCAEAMDYAADAGVDQIEHASFMVDRARTQVFVPAVAHKIAQSGVFVTATLAVTLHPIQALMAKERRTPEEQAYVENSQATHEENLRLFALLLDAGVRFVAGTDAGWLFTTFGSIVDEMELMHEGGMSAVETIASATSRAAEALGIKDKVGTIREGYEADIIVVEGNPAENLGTLRNVRMVMQAGQLRFAETEKPLTRESILA
jgi:imidazolonepropionase-like amidohydrolase